MPKQYVVISGVKDPDILGVVADTFKERDDVPLETLLENFRLKVRMDPTIIMDEGNPRLGLAKRQGWYAYELIEGIVYRRPPIR